MFVSEQTKVVLFSRFCLDLEPQDGRQKLRRETVQKPEEERRKKKGKSEITIILLSFEGKSLHSHSVSAKGVENVGGSGEVEHQLCWTAVRHPLNLSSKKTYVKRREKH